MTSNALDREWMRAVRSEYSHCFGCGIANEMGLQIDGFLRDDTSVTAEFEPKDHHRGFHDILHGGILVAALDEILAWTGILVAGTMAVTATMDLRFRNPATADEPLSLRGELIEQRGRRLILEGSAIQAGSTVATANALFLGTQPISEINTVQPR